MGYLPAVNVNVDVIPFEQRWGCWLVIASYCLLFSLDSDRH